MMTYREVSPKMPLRLALYYAVEGKYFGEEAGGVGWKTDVYVWQVGSKPFRLSEDTLEKELFKLCGKLSPRSVDKRHVEILNNLSGTKLRGMPKLTTSRKKGEDLKIIDSRFKPSGSQT